MFKRWLSFKIVMFFVWLQVAVLPALAQTAPATEKALRDVLNELDRQLKAGRGLTEILTSPVFLILLVTGAGAVITYFGTDGIKLQTLIKGRGTQIVAWLFAAASAGVGGYFTLDMAGVAQGWRGVLLAIIPTVGSFFFARSAHEKKRFNETGLRKPEREALAAAGITDSPYVGLAAAGLRVLGTKLGIPPEFIDTMISESSIEAVDKLLKSFEKERPLNPEELAELGDLYRVDNPVTDAELERARKIQAARRAAGKS